MKRLKIAFLIILIISTFSCIMKPNISYADQAESTASSGDSGIDPFSYDPNNSGKIDSEAVAKHVGPIFNILYTISIIVSVITLSIVGLKFIGASAQEKAEYKQHLLPIATGILIISFLITIISTLAKFAGLF